MGILERGGEIVTKVVPNRKKKAIQAEVREHVLAGSALFTDALKSYEGPSEFQHEVVDHAVEYVRGEVHTNWCENFWSLLKRTPGGTYVSVEPFHLFRYLDEQAFRYNHRKGFNDGQRFDFAVRQIVGKRLTWDQLTGKEMDAQKCASLLKSARGRGAVNRRNKRLDDPSVPAPHPFGLSMG